MANGDSRRRNSASGRREHRRIDELIIWRDEGAAQAVRQTQTLAASAPNDDANDRHHHAWQSHRGGAEGQIQLVHNLSPSEGDGSQSSIGHSDYAHAVPGNYDSPFCTDVRP